MVESNNAINNTVGASISGVTNTLTVTNPSNTASSVARETITVGGASAGDPSLNWNVVGVTDWEMGIDNNDGDKLKISQGTALGTNDTWIMTTAGERTMPLQPCFLAQSTAAQNNITGDGTVYTVVYADVEFDQNSDFDGTSTFTAPVTGKYYFDCSVTPDGITNAMSGGGLRVKVNGADRIIEGLGNPWNQSNQSNGTISFSVHGFAEMDAGDTATTEFNLVGGAKVVDLSAGSFIHVFSGALVC